jgi:hypothetical protein
VVGIDMICDGMRVLRRSGRVKRASTIRMHLGLKYVAHTTEHEYSS